VNIEAQRVNFLSKSPELQGQRLKEALARVVLISLKNSP
jgi:hypothetical protein